jgi:hypothetical protein
MHTSINPFSYIMSSLVTSKNNFLTIFKEDPDDIAEDIIKLAAFGTLNYLVINFAALTFSQILIVNLVAYVPINIAADYIGDLADEEYEIIAEDDKSVAIPFLGNLVGDMAEDICKLFFITKHYLVGTGLSIAEKNLPYPANIIAKIVSYLYATTDLLSDYHQWNQFADSVGNWAEEGLATLLGKTTNDQNVSHEL